MSDLVWFLEKSTLNPDLPYNRLLYNRFLLYMLTSAAGSREVPLLFEEKLGIRKWRKSGCGSDRYRGFIV